MGLHYPEQVDDRFSEDEIAEIESYFPLMRRHG